MGLPIQKAPTHRCKLNDGTEVKFRPFLVKEQKYLLIARESDNPVDIVNAVKNLISEVTDKQVDAEKLPMHDLEYLFLQIRAKSVGESVEVPVFCKNISCDGRGREAVDLTTVEVRTPDEEIGNDIKLNDTLGVTLRIPNAKQLAKADTDGADETDKLINLLKIGIETVYDEETVYNADEISDVELLNFVESLTITQVETINKFFENVPYLAKDIDWACKVCGTEQVTELRGLQNFF